MSFVPIINNTMCGTVLNAGLGTRSVSWAMVHALWPSLLFGNATFPAMAGPLLSEPVNVIFCAAATALVNSSTR